MNREKIEELEARTWGSGGKVTVSPEEAHDLVKEVVRLRGETAMLTDTVVMAAALWFAQLDGPQADYASDCLHDTAKGLVEGNPRLAGSFRSEV
jgi:hypothetical protein